MTNTHDCPACTPQTKELLSKAEEARYAILSIESEAEDIVLNQNLGHNDAFSSIRHHLKHVSDMQRNILSTHTSGIVNNFDAFSHSMATALEQSENALQHLKTAGNTPLWGSDPASVIFVFDESHEDDDEDEDII